MHDYIVSNALNIIATTATPFVSDTITPGLSFLGYWLGLQVLRLNWDSQWVIGCDALIGCLFIWEMYQSFFYNLEQLDWLEVV